MRKIIFRARSLLDGQWIFSALNTYNIDPDTLCQWTGCFDQSGKEIYEGDYVSFIGNHNKTFFGRVAFRNGSFVIISSSDGKLRPKPFLLGDIDHEQGYRLADVLVLGREHS